jgi:signal transduction histidine kinase/iron only hydrogenase large subunit-like protein
MHLKQESRYDIIIKAGRCRRCLYCLQHCPAKAIKLEENNIKVIAERCVLCGSCIKACPHHAMDYKSALDRVTDYLSTEKTIACVDPSFPAALEHSTPRQMVTAIKRLGFTEVWEGAFGAELVSRAYSRLLDGDTRESLLSSSCPVIVFYVQKYFPELIDNLVPVVSPMIAIGKVARRIKPDWKVIYITSCLAQIGEMIAPEVEGIIDEVITFRDLKRMIEKAGIERRGLPETDFDGPRPYLARVVPLIGGMYRSMGTNFDLLMDEVSVTGGHKRAIGALKQVAQDPTRAKFLDLVYCEGCIDGPYLDRELFLLGKRQAIARYVKAEIVKQNYSSVRANIEKYADIDLKRTFRNMEQRLPTPTDEQVHSILRSIGKEPPHNLDCGACGYSTCRDKAIAVGQGMIEAEYCLPYLLEKSKKIYQQLEKSHRELQSSHQELEQAQSQLIRTEKLASLGQLAAGVAHEINNPLGTITIYAHVLLKTLDPNDPRREDIELIIKEAARTKDIVQGLLSFARETKLRPGPTNINELFEDVLGLLVNQSLFQNIKIKKVFSPAIPTITADWTQLKQVFLNILLNAAEAMEGKGTVTITTIAGKQKIKVKIQDTGPGIPPEIMPRLFLPFFTTKEKGTGLGLAISYGIIERHSGKIDVKTQLGKGTVFIVSLPVEVNRERGAKNRLKAIG